VCVCVCVCACVCVCLSVCPVRALTFESLDLYVQIYVFRISLTDLYVNVIWSRLRSQEQKTAIRLTKYTH